MELSPTADAPARSSHPITMLRAEDEANQVQPGGGDARAQLEVIEAERPQARDY